MFLNNRQLILIPLGFSLVGCAAVQPPVLSLDPMGHPGAAAIELMPQLTSGRYTLAVVNPNTSGTINRLDIVPYLQTSPGTFRALLATTGQATDSTDPAVLLKVSMASPSINLSRTITIGNLRPGSTYRVFGQAYNQSGALISLNNNSYVDLTTTDNDRPALGTLPVRLADTPFAGSTNVVVSFSGGNTFDHVKLSQVTVVNGGEVAIAGATTTNLTTKTTKTYGLSNLLPNTTYRVKASVENAANAVLATSSVDIPVTNNTAPAAATLSVVIPADAPPPEILSYTTVNLAGDGNDSYGFVNATGLAARFSSPIGIALDPSGNAYVADWGNDAIRKVTPAGAVTTFATGITSPLYIARDSGGNFYVTSQSTNDLKKVTSGGVVSTFATGFNTPMGVAVDSNGNIYVADQGTGIVKKVTPGGVVSDFRTGISSAFGLAIDASNNVYVSQVDNDTVLKITQAGALSTFASVVSGPKGLACDSQGNLYVSAGYNSTIQKINTLGNVTIIGGSAVETGFVEGVDTNSRFNGPEGIAVDASGKLYVGDAMNNAIRKMQ